MALQAPHIELNNGMRMPMIGLGTSKIPHDVIGDVIKTALEIGYRHIDGAYIYQNELYIGKAIKDMIHEGKINREELFIVGKSWSTYRTRERVVQGCKMSLESYGMDYFDLYLIHFPISFVQTDAELRPRDDCGNRKWDKSIDYLETWKGMEDLVRSGLCKSIGVSNFSFLQIKRLLENCQIKPVTNQVECHPFLNLESFVKELKKLGVTVTAYSPLSSNSNPASMSKCGPKLMENETLKEIGLKYNKTLAQVALRYQIERNVSVIPKSANELHLRDNLNIFDFKLNEEDMKRINSLNLNKRFLTSEYFGIDKFSDWIGFSD